MVLRADGAPTYTGGMTDDEYADMNDARSRRVKIIAWVVIVSLILVGGGATVITLLFAGR